MGGGEGVDTREVADHRAPSKVEDTIRNKRFEILGLKMRDDAAGASLLAEEGHGLVVSDGHG